MRFGRTHLHKTAAAALAWLLCLSLLLPFGTLAAGEGEENPVRVGFYPVASYQETMEDGTLTGFSYDYFMQIQKYTRWNYEFVSASYAQCLQMLQNGEIDVMSGVIKTPAREQQMLFSNYSISNTQNKLYARGEDANLFYESYDAFDGSTVGVMQGVLTDEMQSYSALHGFTVQLVQYTSMAEMEAALLGGEVDLLYAASISNEADTKIVARMDKQPLYFVTAKNRPDIAEQIDDALRKIMDNNPDFYTQMSEKYMLSGANAAATFTREEQAYIDAEPQIYTILNADWAPISYYDAKSGTYKGIVVDVLRRIEDYSGLHFIQCTEAEFNAIAAEDPTAAENVIAILADDNGWAVQQSVMMSNHIADASVVQVVNRNSLTGTGEVLKVAMPNRFYINYVMRDALAQVDVVYYDTVTECLDAVNNGKADATYVNELVAAYYLSLMEYSNLYSVANSGFNENLAFAVNKEANTPLLGILDKSLLCIGTAEIDQIIVQNSIAQGRFSLRGLYYSYPSLFVLCCVLLAGVFAVIVFLIYNNHERKRRTEQELQKEFENSTARTEFFMMISHELRTPLNAIVGYLNLAAEQCRQNGTETEYIKRSQSAAKQLTDIAEDMLDYTRIASDTVQLHSEMFDIKNVVRTVDQNMAQKAAQKDLQYRFTAGDIPHEYVMGDSRRITQVVQNIVSNAVKFTDAGGTVTANISQQEGENGAVVLVFTCRDTGKGMSEEFMQKVCAPFNQGDRAYSRTHGGLGLGLYLTKYFVDAMHGTFAVESRLGEGSCVTITLPLARPNSKALLESNINCAHVRVAMGGGDEVQNAQIKTLLGRLKMQCDVYTESKMLLRRVRSRMGTDYAYALCILDEDMQKEQLAETLAALPAPPVVFALAGSAEKVDALAAETAISHVLYKPVFQSELFDAVINTFGEYTVEPSNVQPPNFAHLHALVVEDNAVNADILCRVLGKTGMATTVCENGKLAVNAVATAPKGTYNIVLMDVQMPVMDGYEATRTIRTLAGQGDAAVPIIAISANAFPEDIEKSLEAGMNQHLSKPINTKLLYETIQKYCE